MIKDEIKKEINKMDSCLSNLSKLSSSERSEFWNKRNELQYKIDIIDKEYQKDVKPTLFNNKNGLIVLDLYSEKPFNCCENYDFLKLYEILLQRTRYITNIECLPENYFILIIPNGVKYEDIFNYLNIEVRNVSFITEPGYYGDVWLTPHSVSDDICWIYTNNIKRGE